MTAKKIERLIEWLTAHGMTDAEIVDCLKFLATGNNNK